MIAKRVSLLLMFCLVSGASSAQQRQDSAARRIFADLNQTRSENHLAPLRWDNALAAAADRHTRDMATHDQLAHELSGEPALGQRIAAAGARVSAFGENVGFSTEGADGVHDAWMHSPGHRANILNGSYDVVGIAAYEVNGKLYATEDFGTAVNVVSAEDAEVTVRETIGKERAAHKLPPLKLLPLSGAHGCDSLTVPALIPGETRSKVRFTTHDPAEFPEVMKARIANPQYGAYWLSVCEQRTGNGFTEIVVYAVFTN